MPVNKDAMARYRIIDRMLADPHKDYTTEQITVAVSRECPKVTKRMIQKDIKALEEEFNKELIRNAGGRGTVKYADQSEPLFFQELTGDEEEILREALRSLGQFEGLENFTWLELLRKKLEMPKENKERPIISFFKNELLQINSNLLGQLFSAISRKKVIRFGYRRFADKNQPYQKITVYPYQLRQYNDRWFLLCNPIGNKQYPYDPDMIYNYALDRMDGKIEYIDDLPYVPTVVDIDARFEEIVGVTYRKDVELDDIYFAVSKRSLPYIQTKFIHATQIELDADSQKMYREKYPSLKDWTFFSIECRPNVELMAKLLSYGEDLVVVESDEIRERLKAIMENASKNYNSL